MGILSALGLGRSRPDFLSTAIDLGISSPWAEGNLATIVPSEIFGADVADRLPMTRAEAMSIPAVAKARNLLVSTISKFPLVALDRAGARINPQPTFLYRDDVPVTPYARMVMTVDDLIFEGLSLWAVERGTNGQITNGAWVPRKRWKIEEGVIHLDDKPADEKEVILFEVPGFAGLLNIGSRTLRGARDTEVAWVSRMKNPVPMTELHISEEGVEQEEIDTFSADWLKKHEAGKPAFGVTTPGTEIRTHGELHTDLYVEGRNAIRTDIGSFLNVNVAMLDGTIGVDSLTYSTKDGERNSFFEFALPFWCDPIEAALSGLNVVPRGQRVRFEKYEGFPLPTGPNTED